MQPETFYVEVLNNGLTVDATYNLNAQESIRELHRQIMTYTNAGWKATRITPVGSHGTWLLEWEGETRIVRIAY